MGVVPRLTVGLPVYNGATFLAESIEALLGQTFGDFELIISDNASTDATPDICHAYAQVDSRIVVHRQERNVGLAPNHNFVAYQARGELFKWASNDDLYARDLLERCVAAMDERPDIVLAHSWTAMIDSVGVVTMALPYPLRTSSLHAPERFRSLLFDDGGDDDGGVIRTPVLLRTAMKDSYHHADRTTFTEVGLYGPFHQVPDWLYFRRDHPERAERAHPSVRARCANMDPRRADRLRHPVVRLYGEYLWEYVAMVGRSPLPASEKAACYRHLVEWAGSRALRRRPAAAAPDAVGPIPDIRVEDVVAGQGENRQARGKAG
jgi:glycosyltransferase involved in cell wall biosynthesis